MSDVTLLALVAMGLILAAVAVTLVWMRAELGWRIGKIPPVPHPPPPITPPRGLQNLARWVRCLTLDVTLVHSGNQLVERPGDFMMAFCLSCLQPSSIRTSPKTQPDACPRCGFQLPEED